jgi:hypothetical protein
MLDFVVNMWGAVCDMWGAVCDWILDIMFAVMNWIEMRQICGEYVPSTPFVLSVLGLSYLLWQYLTNAAH